MGKKLKGLSDIQPHRKNPNRGTERGRYMIEKSLSELGAGRSIVVDKEGRAIGGNHVLEIAAEMGLEVEIIESRGDKLVVVQRNDLDLEDESDDRARKLAYADNRASEVNFDLHPLRVADDLAAGLDLSDFYREDELVKIMKQAGEEAEGEGGGGGGGGLGDPIVAYQLVFDNADQQATFHEFIKFLRAHYEGETISARLVACIKERMAAQEGDDE